MYITHDYSGYPNPLTTVIISLTRKIDEIASHYKLTHTSGGIGVRTPVMASGLTISAFCQLS
ncbi:hypothetical protein MTR_3g067925 [Medicago truncatula]|uniref:Uncharacterized protein n=1 Tax=Medicago truncatula TaxID=3880 RepID=A0A072UYR6_MEDTR|nr:hypothetical protein MTR_3g067925 [Medicago truncatula]